MSGKPSVIYNNDIYLDPIITQITWSGDMTQGFRTLKLSLNNTLDGVHQAVTIELGRELRMVDDDEAELFRGVIFSHDINEKGAMSVTAYDENVYLTKNSDSRKFRNMTASGIIRQLCVEFGIPVGTIADTGYIIPRLNFENKTLWEMMVTALTETKRQTGRRFLISASSGKLNVSERGEKVVDWVIENGVNLTTASYSQSIEDLRNAVKVTANETVTTTTSSIQNLPPEALDMVSSSATSVKKSKKSPFTASARNDALITRFGLMQRVESAGSGATRSSAQQLASETLTELAKIKDEAKVEALGNVAITSGSAVYVIESMTSIVGGFYVITDTHTWGTNGIYTMSLTVSGDESLPTLKYEKLTSAEKDTDATKKSSTKKKGGLTAEDQAALANLG